MQIYVHRNNQQTGPFNVEEIKAQLAAGTISPQDSVWWEGQAGWVTIAQSSLLTPGAAAPVTAAPGALPPIAGGPTVIVAPSSKVAMWALICGCASFLCGIFAAIPAIILGHMGLSEIKKNPGMQGRGMALAGVILGYVITAFSILYIGIVGISVLIALGNQVKDKESSTSIISKPDSSDTSSTNTPDQSTNAPDTSTNAAPDASTNSAMATPADQSTNSPTATPTAPANQ